MKTKKLSGLMGLLMIAFFCISCGNDDNSNGGSGGPASGSRKVKYEITGNFSGPINISYHTESGGSASESIALPWSKEITYAPSVGFVSIGLVGTGGVVGQTATIKVSAGGTQLSSTSGTANADGSIALAAPAYGF